MKLIIPMARKRFKKSSISAPSPVLSLAGRPIILRVLDVVKKVKVSEIIFIVDSDDAVLKELISKNVKGKVRFVLQKDQKGVAHAIFGAKKFVSGEPCLVLFADSIVGADLKFLNKFKDDVVIWTKQVSDPRKFGVVFTSDGFVSRLIEKPESPVSDLAMVGLYYFSNSSDLFSAIAYLIKNKILTKGAYQLTDVLQIMINRGKKVVSVNVDSWFDCGSRAKLIEAQSALIVNEYSKKLARGNVFIKPVFVDVGASVEGSVIGPNVSVGKNAKISKSVISNSIVGDFALVENNNLDSSFVGSKSKVIGSSKRVNVREGGVVRDE